MKRYWRVHTYDRGDMYESIIGPPFKTRNEAVRWVFLNYSKVSYVAKYEIKEHTYENLRIFSQPSF